ncbi:MULTISPECIES: type 1 glutamine amidotransferase [Streptomyces]|uniref:GMP synthase (Glutamine-hydrolyzing) n=1 Tax=Streptomyces clavifer TaxID=68188 RepID=A0ABS4VJJ9_9ACTN|nr:MULTISPECIES: gamma-glutamyl-gamma-aminobutyrate hydrolase family protein [Streptomyces]KQZ03008.1 GMP synthase [Streptomyces sp. Root55]MBP2364101.1 GMP synthase (glutamine-hydrolyzing) [Streptomyces clavifer]MDX2744472.1 gamma-glutamyl-gamma-aminobutyrate hydrolase family protein [Streptomyces sp. NRRL_B-2557]MDX3067959.1 gamma-glutamyl-gamma-aminobutyrate hydrolase family protein [Streptomyces sp. ND04-05B]RPK85575.1 GMP synthase [glutamine-hydrolyzing] [Streptomyces sp. ADI97-07]
MTRPRVLVVNNGTLSLRQLRSRFEALGSQTEAADARSVPARVDGRYQAIVLSGTKVRAYDSEYYKPLIDLVTDADVPVFGICGGLQILAVAAGGRLVEGPQRVGGYEAQVDTEEPLFAHVKPTVTVFHRHTLYLQEAPAGYRTIGRSAHAPVEFLRSDDGRIFGSQAHLEFRKDGLEILRGFAQLYR